MAQFSDGPVYWPWCIQLVHGAHSLRCSHWCPAAFPGTRINAAPQGAAPLGERISNSNCRKAHKSQGMTLDGQPSTTTATTLKPLLSQADKAHLGSSLPTLLFVPLLSSSSAHTDPKSQGQAKPGAPGASESSSTRSQSVLSSGAK